MRTIDPIEHIRAHPEMYLPAGRPDPIYLATRMAEDALLLGAARVEVARQGNWWLVRADRDWLGGLRPPALHEAFSRIRSFPEAGANSMRSEVLLSAFADDVVTAADGRHDLIKGEVADADPVWCALPAPAWRRTVAFRVGGPA